MGLAATLTVGTVSDPGHRLHFAVQYPARNGPGDLHALGIAAHTIRRRIPGTSEGRVSDW